MFNSLRDKLDVITFSKLGMVTFDMLGLTMKLVKIASLRNLNFTSLCKDV